MFNWNLFFILIIACLPGILFLIPTNKIIYASLPRLTTKKIPSQNKFIIISVIQTLLLVGIAAAFGTAVAHKVNLHAPFLEALAKNQWRLDLLWTQIIPGFWLGLAGAIVFLLAYYGYFKSHLDAQTEKIMTEFRQSIGIFGRIFYGGIVEEVLCRWGLMTFFVWLGLLIFGSLSPFVFWSAILISGILFGLGHLPAYLSLGCQKSPRFITFIIILNLWAAIIFGWLFWHYGLCAAMIAHAVFHVIWYPIDRLS